MPKFDTNILPTYMDSHAVDEEQAGFDLKDKESDAFQHHYQSYQSPHFPPPPPGPPFPPHHHHRHHHHHGYGHHGLHGHHRRHFHQSYEEPDHESCQKRGRGTGRHQKYALMAAFSTLAAFGFFSFGRLYQDPSALSFGDRFHEVEQFHYREYDHHPHPHTRHHPHPRPPHRRYRFLGSEDEEDHKDKEKVKGAETSNFEATDLNDKEKKNPHPENFEPSDTESIVLVEKADSN